MESTLRSKETTFTGDPAKQKLVTTKFVVGGSNMVKDYSKIKPENSMAEFNLGPVQPKVKITKMDETQYFKDQNDPSSTIKSGQSLQFGQD